jgi:hypothetical protein
MIERARGEAGRRAAAFEIGVEGALPRREVDAGRVGDHAVHVEDHRVEPLR